MKQIPELIVMLTQNDSTVTNAYEIFEQCKHTKAQYWGFKDKPLPKEEMQRLFAYMRQCGKTTVLEVVEYTEAECLQGAETAVACGCDILMGTMYFDSVHQLCRTHGIRYMPFVGEVTERPSVLNGSADAMIEEARLAAKKGVDGFDLLGYRYTGDAFELNRRFVETAPVPVCIAGSVNSFERLEEILAIKPWAFTIGGAFFEHRFGNTVAQQIDAVIDYLAGDKR